MTMKAQSVADVEGPWVDPQWESGLIERCWRHWDTPVTELPNAMVATFLNQRIAIDLMIEEGQRRLAAHFSDDSELFEGQLAEALNKAVQSRD